MEDTLDHLRSGALPFYSGDQLAVDFVVSGDLDNPKFNLAENFMARLSYGIAEKLGVSNKDIGGSVIGIGTDGSVSCPSSRCPGTLRVGGFKVLFL